MRSSISKMRGTIITRALVVCAALAGASIAGESTFGTFQIAEEPLDARITAMGSAGTALAGGGFAYYNPASPSLASAPFLSAEFGSIPGGMSRSQISTAWMFHYWFAGASMRVHSIDWILSDERGTGGTSSNESLQGSVTGGFTLKNFSSGHQVNFFQERIGDQFFRAWTYSIGALYRLTPKSIVIGASLQNYLRLDTSARPWYDQGTAMYHGAWGLPRYVRAGAAWSDTVPRAGLPFTVSGDIVYSDVYDLVMVPVGAEVWITPYLAGRMGWRINHPSDIFHVGVGLRWSTLSFDFDYGITQPVTGADIESKVLCGLTYAIKSWNKSPAVKTRKQKQPKAAAPDEGRTFAPPKRIIISPKAADTVKPAPAAPVKDSTVQPNPGPGADSSAVVPLPQPEIAPAIVPADSTSGRRDSVIVPK